MQKPSRSVAIGKVSQNVDKSKENRNRKKRGNFNGVERYLETSNSKFLIEFIKYLLISTLFTDTIVITKTAKLLDTEKMKPWEFTHYGGFILYHKAN